MSLSRKSGFTLLELLVVIAIIGILAGMLFPAIQNALLKGKALKAGNAMGSKGIQGQIYAESLERDAHGMDQLYPKADAFATSTEYFKDLLTNPTQSIENVDFTFFSLPGTDARPLPGNPDDVVDSFEAENNGWCVVEGISTESNPNIPLFFTKNVNISGDNIAPGSLSALGTDTAILDGDGYDILGRKMAIVVYAQGAVKTFEKSQFLTANEFNPSSASNTFIRP